MKKYSVNVTMADGAKVEANVTARNLSDAIGRLMRNEQYREAMDGKKVESIDVTPIPIEPIDETRFAVRTAVNKRGWYVVEDAGTGFRIEWKKGMYNETNRVLPPEKELEAADAATALREIGEYLHDNFSAII
jgi:hypothetical protein